MASGAASAAAAASATGSRPSTTPAAAATAAASAAAGGMGRLAAAGPSAAARAAVAAVASLGQEKVKRMNEIDEALRLLYISTTQLQVRERCSLHLCGAMRDRPGVRTCHLCQMCAVPPPQHRFAAEAARTEDALRRVTSSWRETMRLERLAAYRETLDMTAKAFEREVEKVKAGIEAAQGDLAGAELQIRAAWQIHAVQVDDLLRLQRRRVDDLGKAFADELTELQTVFTEERGSIVAEHTKVKAELVHYGKAIRADAERKLMVLEADFSQEREGVRRRNFERIHSLQTDMDAAIEILEKAFEDAHSRYLANTDFRTQEFKKLSARGQHDTQVKERQKRAIKRLHTRVLQAQNKATYLIKDSAAKNREVAKEKETLYRHLMSLKAKSAAAHEAAAERLRALVRAVQTSRTTCDENAALAQRILTLYELVRAMEPASARLARAPLAAPPPAEFTPAEAPPQSTEAAIVPAVMAAVEGSPSEGEVVRRASVVPLRTLGLRIGDDGGTLRPGQRDDDASEPAPTPRSGRTTMDEMVEEAGLLHNFYLRFNTVTAEEAALQRRAQLLRAEREELQAALAACMAETAVSPTTLESPNALFVVNGRTSAVLTSPVTLAAGALPIMMQGSSTATLLLTSGVLDGYGVPRPIGTAGVATSGIGRPPTGAPAHRPPFSKAPQVTERHVTVAASGVAGRDAMGAAAAAAVTVTDPASRGSGKPAPLAADSMLEGTPLRRMAATDGGLEQHHAPDTTAPLLQHAVPPDSRSRHSRTSGTAELASRGRMSTASTVWRREPPSPSRGGIGETSAWEGDGRLPTAGSLSGPTSRGYGERLASAGFGVPLSSRPDSRLEVATLGDATVAASLQQQQETEPEKPSAISEEGHLASAPMPVLVPVAVE